jgi:hypothetical protein
MRLEPDLAVERPDALHTWVGGKGSKLGMVGGCEVLKDGELAAGLLGGEVLDRGEGALLVTKDELANVA